MKVVPIMPVEGNGQSFGLLHDGASLAVGEAVDSRAARSSELSDLGHPGHCARSWRTDGGVPTPRLSLPDPIPGFSVL